MGVVETPLIVGQGIYPLAEAARYAGLPSATVRAWFRARADGRGPGPLFRSDIPAVGADHAISFLNLIEVYVARFFRQEGVALPVLRGAREILAAELGTPHPFAHADLRTDGRRVILRTGDRDLVDVISKQYFFGQMNLGRITYGAASRLAETWGIADGVRIDPRVGHGRPVVERSGVATFVVANQFRANAGNAALVADLFGISAADVLHAVAFEDGLKRRAA